MKAFSMFFQGFLGLQGGQIPVPLDGSQPRVVLVQGLLDAREAIVVRHVEADVLVAFGKVLDLFP